MFSDWPLRCIYIERAVSTIAGVDVVRQIAAKRHPNLRYVYYVVTAAMHSPSPSYSCYRLDPPGPASAPGFSGAGLSDGVTEIGRFEAETIRQAFLAANAETARNICEHVVVYAFAPVVLSAMH